MFIEIILDTIISVNKEIEEYPTDMTITDERFGEYMELMLWRKELYQRLINYVFPLAGDHKVKGMIRLLNELDEESKEDALKTIKMFTKNGI